MLTFCPHTSWFHGELEDYFYKSWKGRVGGFTRVLLLVTPLMNNENLNIRNTGSKCKYVQSNNEDTIMIVTL